MYLAWYIRQHRLLLFTPFQSKQSVSSLLDGSLCCLLDVSELQQPLITCLELKQSLSSLVDIREHRVLLFTPFKLKRRVSCLLDGSLSWSLEGSELRHPLFACLELKPSVSSLVHTRQHRLLLFSFFCLNEVYLAC